MILIFKIIMIRITFLIRSKEAWNRIITEM